MNLEAILMIASHVSAIIARHYEATGTLLTDAEVRTMLLRELDAGDSTIARWFRSKGLEPPT